MSLTGVLEVIFEVEEMFDFWLKISLSLLVISILMMP